MCKKLKSILFNNWFVVGIIIILIGFDIFIHIPIIDIKCNYFSAMIGFVGVLATFIVVSNYAQVKEIERKTNTQLSIIKNDFNEKINKINSDLGIMSKQIKDTIENVLVNDVRNIKNRTYEYIDNYEFDKALLNSIYLSTSYKALKKNKLSDIYFNLSLEIVKVIEDGKLVFVFDTKNIEKCLHLLNYIDNTEKQTIINFLNKYKTN